MSAYRLLIRAPLVKLPQYKGVCKCKIQTRGTSEQRVIYEKSPWPRLQWFYIPASVGFGVVCLIQLKHMLKRQNSKLDYNNNVVVDELPVTKEGYVFSQWQVDLLKNIPTRFLSRMWGHLCNLHIPVFLRKPLLNSYSSFFSCNLEEAEVSDVTKYETFNQFFTRKLKSNARIIDPAASLVSPVDAVVVSMGSLSPSHLELDQVKGFSYPLNIFLGPRHPFLKGVDACFSDSPINYLPGSCGNDIDRSDYKIFYCTLYLGPGDYHWFHSPTEWTVEHRRHIPGHLFSVNPSVLRSIKNVFNFNERVILSGHWQYGLFMYAAVGAYNVGSIRLDTKMEKHFETNKWNSDDIFKDRLYGNGVLYGRGETVGGFELGSTLVLAFTAPKDFEFAVEVGQKLEYGEKLGNIGRSYVHNTA